MTSIFPEKTEKTQESPLFSGKKYSSRKAMDAVNPASTSWVKDEDFQYKERLKMSYLILPKIIALPVVQPMFEKLC